MVAAVNYPTPTVLAVNPASTVVEPWSSRVHRGEEAQADQGAAQVQQTLEQVGPPLVADAEAAEAEQPSQRPLHHPSVPTQLPGGVDAPGAEGAAEVRVVVGLAGVQLRGTLPLVARVASSPLWRWLRPSSVRSGVRQKRGTRKASVG